jgi:hypothetical protein
MGNAGTAAAVDPEITADVAKFQYWVEAVFADGSRTDPGPVASVTLQSSSTFGWSPAASGVTATVGGTMTITWNGQQTRGSSETWTWDYDVSKVPVYVYFISVEISAGITPFGPAWVLIVPGPFRYRVFRQSRT